MYPDPNSEWKALKKFSKKLVGVTAFIVTIAGAVRQYYGSIGEAGSLQGSLRFFIILAIGTISSIAYGLLWTFAEHVFGWNYGAGGAGQLPSGFSAFILSLTLTLPLAIVPSIYEIISHEHILPDKHWLAVGVAIICAGVVHLLMYGIGSIGFVGIRAHLMPPIGNVGVLRSVLTEAIWGVADFGGIALTYRVIVSFLSPERPAIFGLRVLLFSLVFVVGMSAFIIVRYPGSLEDPSWVQVRGFLAGLLLPVCLSLAMYL